MTMLVVTITPETILKKAVITAISDTMTFEGPYLSKWVKRRSIHMSQSSLP